MMRAEPEPNLVTRRDELQQTTTGHRPGLLDGPVLRQLMEERHEILAALSGAERKVTVVPTERRAAERDLAEAEQRMAVADASLARARAVLDRYDRPLHRRRHASEIDAARRDTVRLPSAIAEAQSAAEEATARLDELDVDHHDALELLRRRPSLDAKVSDLDARLDADLRRRTRIARLEQPTAIIEVLGDRPSPGAPARAWDQAAGRLHQHQAAFDLAAGVGPRPGFFDNSAYVESRRLVEQQLEVVVDVPQQRGRGIEPPGISL